MTTESTIYCILQPNSDSTLLYLLGEPPDRSIAEK